MSHILVPVMSQDFVPSASAKAAKAQSAEHANLTVLSSAGALEWTVSLPLVGKWYVHVLLAAGESRPCELSLNGQRQSGKVLDGTTGGWSGVHLKWFALGPFEFKEGNNSFRLEGAAGLPHLKMFIFSPESSLLRVEAKNLAAHGSGISPEEGTHRLLYGWSQVSFIEYKVHVPKAGKWFLHAIAAARSPYAYTVSINGQPQQGAFSMPATGSSDIDGLAWHSAGPYAFRAGENTLRLDFSNWTASLREFILAADPSGLPDEAMLRELERRLAEQERIHGEHDRLLREHDTRLREHDARLTSQDARLTSQDARIAALEAAMRKCGSCEDKIAALTDKLAQCGACAERITAQERTIADLLARVDDLTKKIAKGCPTPEPPPAENLEDIEGIGPKLAEVLHAAGLRTLKQLASTEVAELQKILKAAGGNKYARNDPSSWPQQARLMVEGKKAELHALQETLRAGRSKV